MLISFFKIFKELRARLASVNALYGKNSRVLMSLNLLTMKNIHDNVILGFFVQGDNEPPSSRLAEENTHSLLEGLKSSCLSFEHCKYEGKEESEINSNYEYFFLNMIKISTSLNKFLLLDQMVCEFITPNHLEYYRAKKFRNNIVNVFQTKSNQVALDLTHWVGLKGAGLLAFYSDLLRFIRSALDLMQLNQRGHCFGLLFPHVPVFPFTSQVGLTRTRRCCSTPTARTCCPSPRSRRSFSASGRCPSRPRQY